MNLQKINQHILEYKKLINDPEYDGWYLWEGVHNCQQNWNIDAIDFGAMYRKCFDTNAILWQLDHYNPVKAMINYININEDLARAMFKDLFNEQKEITGRISRFIFQCDEFYKIDRQSREKVLSHEHGDKRMIFVYLAFRYPEKYSLFDFQSFRTFLQEIGSAQTLQIQDTDRFIKVCRTLAILIAKDDDLIQLVNQHISPTTNGALYPMLLVYEIYQRTVLKE